MTRPRILRREIEALRKERDEWRAKAYALVRGRVDPHEKSLRNKWLVVIVREQEVSVFYFDTELDARGFFGTASTQWSESFLAQIVIGPQV